MPPEIGRQLLPATEAAIIADVVARALPDDVIVASGFGDFGSDVEEHE